MNKTTMFLLGTAMALLFLVVIGSTKSSNMIGNQNTAAVNIPNQGYTTFDPIPAPTLLPDLIVSSVYFDPNTTYVGTKSVSYGIIIKNLGGSVTVPANTRVTLSNDGGPVIDTTFGMAVTLDTGSSYALAGNLASQYACYSSGTFFFNAMVDVNNALSESDESNNTLQVSINCSSLKPITQVDGNILNNQQISLYDPGQTGNTSGTQIYNIDPQVINILPQIYNPNSPTVTTKSATNVDYTSATLNGTVNPHGFSTSVWFEFNGSLKKRGTNTLTGSTVKNYSFDYDSLNQNTIYDYRMCAESSEGTSCGSFVELKTRKDSSNNSNNNNNNNTNNGNSVGNNLGSGPCPITLYITDKMKKGDRDGKYSTYNYKITSQINLLQADMNRILASKFTLASGPVDGIFGSLTAIGVMRLQDALNSAIIPSPHLVLDGIVGPYTLAALNNSCGALER